MGSNRLRDFLLIGTGGTLGTAARYALDVTFPAVPGTMPVTIFLINMAGAFLLGLLLEGLYRRGSDVGWRRDVRLLVGTGLLGGFTTYSTFAVGAAQLLGTSGVTAEGFLYLFATVTGGTTMAILGIVCAQWLPKREGGDR